jgi:hypothetical protein
VWMIRRMRQYRYTSGNSTAHSPQTKYQ